MATPQAPGIPADPMLLWAKDCAALLTSARGTWHELAGSLPLGVRRRSFVIPALAVSAVFLAGAWWLHSRSLHETGRTTADG
jgi:hypothetical protein